MRGVATTVMGVLGVLIYADVAALLVPFGLIPLALLLPLRLTDMHEDEGWEVGSYPAERIARWLVQTWDGDR